MVCDIVCTGEVFLKEKGFALVYSSKKCVDIIFTATPESFRVAARPDKVFYIGQAVLLERFARPASFVSPKSDTSETTLRCVTVGRVTPIKNIDVLIKAVKILRDRGILCEVTIVGEAVTGQDHVYKKDLEKLTSTLGVSGTVHFVGSVPNKDLAPYYWKHDVSVNLCPTGGLDKAVLESIAAGTPAVVTNQAFKEYLGRFAPKFFIKERDPEDCARVIELVTKSPDRHVYLEELQKHVKEKSSLDAVISRVITILTQ